MAARKSNAAADTSDQVVVITRILDAPPEVVFKAWTDPEQVVKWWGPKGFTVPFCEMDVRVGGAWRMCMRSAEGVDYWHHGTFREVVKPRRLVFTHWWEEENTYETLITVTFDDQGGKTKMAFEHGVFKSVETRDSHAEGWSECFDNLAALVAKA